MNVWPRVTSRHQHNTLTSTANIKLGRGSANHQRVPYAQRHAATHATPRKGGKGVVYGVVTRKQEKKYRKTRNAVAPCGGTPPSTPTSTPKEAQQKQIRMSSRQPRKSTQLLHPTVLQMNSKSFSPCSSTSPGVLCPPSWA